MRALHALSSHPLESSHCTVAGSSQAVGRGPVSRFTDTSSPVSPAGNLQGVGGAPGTTRTKQLRRLPSLAPAQCAHTHTGRHTPSRPLGCTIPPEVWRQGPGECVAGEPQLREVGRQLPAAGERPRKLIGAQVEQLHTAWGEACVCGGGARALRAG